MRRHRFRPGDDGVSTVVGVVLLVGIAVMLMTTVGAFVLGWGPGQPPPEPEIQFYEEDGNVTITVVKPAGIEHQNLDVRVNGSTASTKENATWYDSSTLDQADYLVVHDSGSPVPSGATIRVIWEAPGGGRTEIVGEYETI